MGKIVYVVVNHCYWSSSGNLISETPVCVCENRFDAQEKCDYLNKYCDSDEYRTHRFWFVECKMY